MSNVHAKQLRYFSTFSGIGGFEIGIKAALDNRRNTETPTLAESWLESMPNVSDGSRGWTNSSCVGYSEIDKYATSVYERNFYGHKNFGDITKINAEELPDFDLLVGGFPCQAFSIAGKRAGFDDTRGTLFFDLARILRAKQPRLFVFENVKGLLSHDNGNTFKTIIQTLDELGYDLQWQVLNSKNHGVPQNRERIYIVGHLRGTPRPQVFPLGSNNSEDTRKLGQELAPTLDANYYKGWSPNGQQSSKRQHIQQLNQPTHSNDRVYGIDGVSPTLNTMQGGNRQPFIAAQRGRGNPPIQTLEERHDGVTNTLTSVTKDNYVMPKIRRLTPIECERLQGFPDDWTAMSTNGKVSDTQRYKMCGNAVTTNVVQAVMERLLAQEFSQVPTTDNTNKQRKGE